MSSSKNSHLAKLEMIADIIIYIYCTKYSMEAEWQSAVGFQRVCDFQVCYEILPQSQFINNMVIKRNTVISQLGSAFVSEDRLLQLLSVAM